jgi:hypothetical protein
MGQISYQLKPEKHAERLRGVGNSSGDENGSNSMKYWEIIADKLSAAGWSWGYCSAVTKHGWRWVVDAYVATDGAISSNLTSC